MLNINYKNDVREKQRRDIIAMLRCLRDVRAMYDTTSQQSKQIIRLPLHGLRGRNLTVTIAMSPINVLVFSSAFVGGMNAARFNNFLTQARTNLDPEESVISVYDGHRPPETLPFLSQTWTWKKLPPYSPFLNIMEQAISRLKATIKADISRPKIQRHVDDRGEARVRGIPLGEFRT